MDEETIGANYLETQLDKFVFRVRTGYLYTAEDVWLHPEGAGVRVGLTDYLQRLSGDVAFCKFAPTGSLLSTGGKLAEIETIKTTLVVPSPLEGQLVTVNDQLTDQPELINGDPFGDGWLALLEPSGDLTRLGLLDAEAYFVLMREKLAEEDRKRRGVQ